MITEDYVSFETAKLLKEKGFNGYECEVYEYYGEDGEKTGSTWTSPYPRPSLAMAMKWLREVHNISIEVVYDCSNDKTETISWWLANIKHINSDSSKENDCLTAYNSYEEACEAACIYVLKNLI